nr:uncharacterized protein LOC109178736 [Ipomoea batatas]
MAAWPPISTRSTPIDNATGNPTANAGIGNTAPASSVPATATRTNNSEVTFDPQTQSNPYFLHANESPALELVSFPLDGSNYHPWARAMSMALSCKNKIAFVNGTITKPSTDNLERYLAWERCNNHVCSWIVRTLTPTIGQSVLWIDTAYGIWNDLKRRFSKQDLFRIAEIKCAIYQTKQGENSLNEYFTKQKLLWDELSILRPLFILPTMGNLPIEVPEIPQTYSQVSSSNEQTCLHHGEAPEAPIQHLATNSNEQQQQPLSPQSETVEQPPEVTHISPVTRRSTRHKQTPTYLQDYVCQSAAVKTSPHPICKVMDYRSEGRRKKTPPLSAPLAVVADERRRKAMMATPRSVKL